MRSLKTHAIAAAAALLSLTPAVAQVNDYHDIKTPPLHQVKVEQPKRFQLANGMVIFLIEDHELPLISGRARVRGGGRDVAADKAGLMGIYGQSWRTGGTDSKTGDQLDDALEARAAKVETQGGEDSTAITINVLKGDFDTVFPVFVDLLQHPAFRQEKVDLAKTQANTAISRRNDDPRGIGDREENKLGYGTGSPYARQPEYSTIASITRDDLIAFHHKYVHPNNIILGLTGDFDSAAMEAKLRKAFGSWPKGPAAPGAPDPAMSPAKPGVYYIAKDDVTQSNVYVVHGGPTRKDNPDYWALQVMNEILSGGFSGRLMNDIRTQRGLAYGIGGGVVADWDHPGLFHIWMGTKSGSTAEAIGALRTDLNDLQTKPFTAEELAQAKDSILNAYIFTMDSKAKVLRQRMDLEFYGFPADWYQQFTTKIQAVTAEDVSRVAKKYVMPDQVALLVVGKEKDFDKPLSTFGPVTTIDITIPEAGAKGGSKSAAAKPAASNAEGLALVKKVLDFTGGRANVDKVQAVRQVGSLTMQTPQGPMDVEVDTVTKFPDMRRSVIKTPMGEMTMVATPDAAFVISPMGSQDLPSSQREAQRAESRSDLISILKNSEKPGYTFTVTGTEKIGDVNAQVLEISADGSPLKWYVDPATGKVLRKVAQGRQGETTTDYSDWKSYGDLMLPVAFTVTTNGQKSGGGKLTNIELNPTIDPKLFEKPAAKP